MEEEQQQPEFQSFAEEDYHEIESLLKCFYADAKSFAPRSWTESDERFADVKTHANILSLERGQERICFLLEKYQEQSELLDPHLEFFTTSLMGFLRVYLGRLNVAETEDAKQNLSAATESVHVAFKVVYMLCKVRGYKTISKFFPHEVSDLEQTWNFLRMQNRSDFRVWETRYCLFLWLAIIALIPFNLATVDSTVASTPSSSSSSSTSSDDPPDPVILGDSLLARMVNYAVSYLSDTGAVREAAAIFIARLFSRSDIFASHNDLVAQFFEWAHRISESKDADVFTRVGSLYCICCTLKKAPRSFMMQYLEGIFAIVVQEENWNNSKNILVRKLSMKIVQRVGLTLLPPRVATWRYQRGFRSLEKNLQLERGQSIEADEGKQETSTSSTGLSINTTSLSEGNDTTGEGEDEDSDDDFEAPEIIEDVIQQLLLGLRDRDTVVRWSAAKGVGRITMRLPLEFGDDVVETVLDLFDEGEGDGAWHGGCLALAELARRGLLLPARLEQVVPLAMQALLYDVRMNLHSIGSHVRDAACYLCWAFARAFAPEVMRPYVGELARGLLTLAVYDREVNVRRAASAAFQENVGRQGIFPHGIDINTTADYFALGKRTHAYLEIGFYIAQYDEYKFHLVDHLASIKSKHWDVTVRELTAKTIAKLISRDGVPLYVEQNALPVLITNCLSQDLFTRHGACCAVGRVLVAMRAVGHVMDDRIVRSIVRLVAGMEETGMFNSSGGQMMREAACHLVHRISLSDVALNSEEIASFQLCINQGLHHPHDDVVSAAAAAMKVFGRVYYDTFSTQLHEQLTEELIKHLATDKLPEGTRGVALALGLLPVPLLVGDVKSVNDQVGAKSSVVLNSVVCALLRAADVKQQSDTETRRNALKSLVQVVSTLAQEAGVFVVFLTPDVTHFAPPSATPDAKRDTGLLVEVVCEVLLAGVQDYSTDKRGDVGSWVREEAMKGMHGLLLRTVDGGESKEENALVLSEELVQRCMCALVKQMVEKINRVRGIAGELFEALVRREPAVPFIPHHCLLQELMGDLEKSALAALPEEVRSMEAVHPVSHIGWSTPELLHVLLPRLLVLEQYCFAVMDGMVLSVGGLTESIVRFSSEGLLEYVGAFVENDDDDESVERENNAGLERVFSNLLQLMSNYKADARVVIPIFKTFDLLFTNCVFDFLPEETRIALGLKLHAAVLSEIRGCKDITKIMAAISVLLGLVAFPLEVCSKSIHTVLLLLVHGFPKVRRMTAEKFYTALMTLDLDCLGVSSESLALVSKSLVGFPWDKQGQIEKTRAERNLMYEWLNLEVPAKVKAKPTVKKTNHVPGKYEGGYAEFVRDLNFN